MENNGASRVVSDHYARKDFGQFAFDGGTVVPEHTHRGAQEASDEKTSIINQDSEPIVARQKIYNTVERDTFKYQVRQKFTVKV